jgi:hypothetical protein
VNIELESALVANSLTVRKILDVCHPQIRDTFMFDIEFKRSKQYFTILQMLRIFHDWISFSIDSFKHSVDYLLLPEYHEYEHNLNASSRQMVRSNWEALLAYHEEIAKPLLDRIEKKTEEVKSLRDGVCCFLNEPV